MKEKQAEWNHVLLSFDLVAKISSGVEVNFIDFLNEGYEIVKDWQVDSSLAFLLRKKL